MGKKFFGCSIACAVFSFLLVLFVLVGFDPLLTSFIESSLVMSPETYELWGANPGASKTLTLRNFTFYQFTNPRAYLYRHQTPRFHEITGFLYQQRSNFTDYTYNEDSSQVDFNYWLFFTQLENTRDLNQSITILNVVPLSFWSQLDSVGPETFAIQGFGGLFVEINNTIKMQVIGQGVSQQFLQHQSSLSAICKQIDISQPKCEFLWDDILYGLSNPNNYEVWVNFAFNGDFNSESLLYDYFGLSQFQMSSLKKILWGWCGVLNNIVNNWYCDGRECSNYELVILQMSSGGLTSNPPSGDSVESICMTGNVTCEGSPQIPTYLHHEFKSISNESKYQGLKFSTQTVSQLFKPDAGVLLNIGNLTRLFRTGEDYDQFKKAQTLQQLQRMTHSDSPDHAFVIWNYVKYFTNQFVLKASQGGTAKRAAMAGIFSQALYQSVTQFGDWALREMLTILAAETIKSCEDFLFQTVAKITSEKVHSICENVTMGNYSSFWQMLQPCSNGLLYGSFRETHKLSLIDMQEYCDETDVSVYSVLEDAHRRIKLQYGCNISNHCTKHELAVKQFINSSITLSPISSSIKQYQPALSAKTWNSNLPEFQYRNYLQEYYGNANIDPQIYSNYTRLNQLLSFDSFFSAPMMITLLITQNMTRFQELFYWSNATLLKNYIRFIVIEVGFGGYTVTKTVKELIFGYEDEFLQALKQTDPMLGGDPSLSTLVALNQPNCSLADASLSPQRMYTGYSSPDLTRNYISMYHEPFILFNKTYFDGYDVRSEWVHPFKKKAPIFGTDAFQNAPNQSPGDSVYVYVNTLYRVGKLDYDEKVRKYGFGLYKFKISDSFLGSSSIYPQNDMYYQDIDNFINMSFAGVPIFISRNHMMGSEAKWNELIQVYDQSGVNKQEPSQWDETYLLAQPVTGASFTAVIFLQTNLYTPKDELYTNERRMIPVFSLYRSGNLTESVAEDLFGDLNTALAARQKLLLFGLIGLLMSVMFIALERHKRELRQAERVRPSLLESDVSRQEPTGEQG